MSNKFDFDKLRKEIENLSIKEQLKRLIIARADYEQNLDPREIVFGLSFADKCNLEIKEIMDLDIN